jgi:predicted DNA-binding protein (MmcQ/YjbR family)
MVRDEVLATCLNLRRAEETYPFGDGVAVIKAGGKLLALVPLLEEPGVRQPQVQPRASA